MQRKRKNIPHLSPLQFHNSPQIQFITICAEGRAPILACEEMHGILRSIWADANFWLVGRYVLMPDHLHLFCAPGKVDYPLEKWIAFWKREAALRWSDGAQHAPEGLPFGTLASLAAENRRYSSETISIGSFARMKVTMRHGITFGKIPSRQL